MPSLGIGLGIALGMGGGVPAADTTAPVLSSASIPAAGTYLDLSYGEALDAASVPAAGDFALHGTNATIASVSIPSASVCRLTFTTVLYATTAETVTVDYTPGVNKLRDAAGNNCVALSGRSVTNGSTLPTQLTGADATQTYSFTGSVSGQLCTGRIYLPAGYTPASATTYPVMLCMHGKGGSSSTSDGAVTAELKDAITAAQIRKCILVMTDSDGADWGQDVRSGGSGSVKAETKVISDVIPWVEARTRANGTRVGTGFSMGGNSLTTIAMKHIGFFAAIWVNGTPNIDVNPASGLGTTNNLRWTNGTFADLGANDTDDVELIWGPVDTAPHQATTLAAMTPDMPLASATGGALANLNTASIISSLPIFQTKSAADAVTLNHMDAAAIGYTALGIPHSIVDLVTPTHNMGQYYSTAQGKSTVGAGNGFMWLELVLANGDAKAPQISGAPVVNAAGTTVTITFDKTLTANSPTAAQFTLGGTFCTVASASASGTTVVLTLATTGVIHAGAAVTVSMASADAATKVLSAAGVPAAPRSSVACTNNSTVTPLTIVTSASFRWWLRSDLGVTQAAGTVSAWNDSSAAGRNFSQGSGTLQPAYSATGAPGSTPSITFDGSDDTMSSSALDFPAPGTTAAYFFALAKQVTYTTLDRFWSAASGGLQVGPTGTTPAITMRNTTSVNSNTAMTVNAWHVLEAGFLGSVADWLKVDTTTVAAGSTAGTTDPANGAFSLGSAGGVNPANVAFAEFICTAGIPNGTELTELRKYAFGRYGIAA